MQKCYSSSCSFYHTANSFCSGRIIGMNDLSIFYIAEWTLYEQVATAAMDCQCTDVAKVGLFSTKLQLIDGLLAIHIASSVSFFLCVFWLINWHQASTNFTTYLVIARSPCSYWWDNQLCYFVILSSFFFFLQDCIKVLQKKFPGSKRVGEFIRLNIYAEAMWISFIQNSFIISINQHNDCCQWYCQRPYSWIR